MKSRGLDAGRRTKQECELEEESWIGLTGWGRSIGLPPQERRQVAQSAALLPIGKGGRLAPTGNMRGWRQEEVV